MIKTVVKEPPNCLVSTKQCKKSRVFAFDNINKEILKLIRLGNNRYGFTSIFSEEDSFKNSWITNSPEGSIEFAISTGLIVYEIDDICDLNRLLRDL